jgi:hypothetical protein
MAGGATPATTESDIHYTEGKEGIPFIRVQNLSTTGKLNLEDCKQITRQTHMSLLQRSQLHGGELLVKITGVGRMAIASVVPEGFEGNINQHIVAIRTKDIQTSETLAAYLNLDIAERLASRRSTGGTRPALDYPALLSIPVVFDERIPRLISVAVRQHDEKIFAANNLLRQIDEVLLAELGISPMPTPPNTIEKRIFKRHFSEITGGRFDAASHWKRLTLLSNRYPSAKLTDWVSINPPTRFSGVKDDDSISFVPMDSISEIYGEIDVAKIRPACESGAYTTFQEGDIIWAKITPCMENGKSAIAENLVDGYGFGSTEFHVFRPRNSEIRVQYLHALLRLTVVRDHARLFFGGSAGHQRVDDGFFSRLEIPLPPLIIQDKIIETITKHKEEARRLFREADAGVKKAKECIEVMILGEGVCW